MLFVKNLKLRINKTACVNRLESVEWEMPEQFGFINDMYLVTIGSAKLPFNCNNGLIVQLSGDYLKSALHYFFLKASLEIKKFTQKRATH